MKRLLAILLTVMSFATVFTVNQTGAQASTEVSAEEVAVSAAPSGTTQLEVTSVPAEGRARRYHAWYTWRRSFAGLRVQWYKIDVRWTGNGHRVYNVDIGRDGGGSWGWHYCGSRPKGRLWMPFAGGHRRFYMRAYGFGHFGHWPISPGCVLGNQILGGSLTVSATGWAYVRHGSCCD